MESNYFVINFYQFTPINSPEAAREKLQAFCKDHGIIGLIILAQEGLNGTLTSTQKESIDLAKQWLMKEFFVVPEVFKESTSFKNPFKSRIQIRIRSEIVTLNRPDLVPKQIDDSYLSPEEWESWMQKSKDEFTLIDTRNDYEYQIGSFKGAINPKIDQFTQFPVVLNEEIKADKEKPVLIFCTGGIRCEKATLDLKQMGYKKVYQLHGGILRYLERFPNKSFDGECFVFDERVAVDQNLNASSTYVLCPHCGDPAKEFIQCVQCGKSQKICNSCLHIAAINDVCSKTCAHRRETKLRKEERLAKKAQLKAAQHNLISAERPAN